MPPALGEDSMNFFFECGVYTLVVMFNLDSRRFRDAIMLLVLFSSCLIFLSSVLTRPGNGGTSDGLGNVFDFFVVDEDTGSGGGTAPPLAVVEFVILPLVEKCGRELFF